MQTQSNIAYPLPEVIEYHNIKSARVSTTLLESLTSHTVDDCIKELQFLVNSFFMSKKELIPGLVKRMLYAANKEWQSLINEYFSSKELSSLQKEVENSIQQKTSRLWAQAAPDYRFHITVNPLSPEVGYLTELLTELQLTLKTFYVSKKLGDKGIGMFTEQVKLDRIKSVSSYLEEYWLEPEQVTSHCEEKLKQCLLGLVNNFEEQLTEQLTGEVVDKIYHWYDSYVENIA